MLIINLLINVLLTMVFILVAIAFFTLLERKILGYCQLRKGPDKIALKGLLQPFADAIKLFLKQITLPSSSNAILFFLIPVLSLFLALSIWVLYPSPINPNNFKYGLLLFLALSRANVYIPLIGGWASNSKYSLIGALRNRAQSISYEVRLALILLCPIIIISRFNLSEFKYYSLIIIILIPNFLIFLITLLAETNRTPFDLAEGESELVSGFNTEYGSASFALIFIAEYINILFISVIRAYIFFYFFTSPFSIINQILTTLVGLAISIFFVWVRATIPRIRYDQLIYLCWKTILPITISSTFAYILIFLVILFVSF